MFEDIYAVVSIPCYNSDNSEYIEHIVSFEGMRQDDIDFYTSEGYAEAEEIKLSHKVLIAQLKDRRMLISQPDEYDQDPVLDVYRVRCYVSNRHFTEQIVNFDFYDLPKQLRLLNEGFSPAIDIYKSLYRI